MARGEVVHPWEEEVQLWELVFIKRDVPEYRIPSQRRFSDEGVLEKVVNRDRDVWEDTSGKRITDYRVVKSKKRWFTLSYPEWRILPRALQQVHPRHLEYAREQAREAHSTEDIDDAIHQFTSQIRFRAFSLPLVPDIPSGFGYNPYRRHAEIIEGIISADTELASLLANFQQVAFEERRDEACRLWESIENRMGQHRTNKGPGC